MGRRPGAWLCLMAALMLVVACTPDKARNPSPTPSAARHPVADRPPYLCHFIPQAAVAELTGYTGEYTEGPRKGAAAGPFCVVTNEVQTILATGYDRSGDRQLLENYLKAMEEEGRVKLAPELGAGEIGDGEMAGFPVRSAAAWFRCGRERPLVLISVKKNPGRDQDYDLVQLVRIAERRFAEMFSCELGGPPPG